MVGGPLSNNKNNTGGSFHIPGLLTSTVHCMFLNYIANFMRMPPAVRTQILVVVVMTLMVMMMFVVIMAIV